MWTPYLLYNSASICLSGKIKHFAVHCLSELRLVCHAAVLKKLLNHVVAKQVFHQLDSIWLNLAEDPLLFLAVRGQQFLLDESRAILITTKLNDVTTYVFKLPAL
jgi:hypothetical protein